MAIEIERLIATLEANFNKYDRALNKALGNTNTTFTRIEQRGKQLETRLSNLGGSTGKLFAGFAAGVSLQGAQQLIDSAIRIQNALKVAGLEGKDLTKVYDALFESAQRNAAPLESLVTLYGRAAQQQKELGVSSADLLKFTDNVAVSLRVAGSSAGEAQGALLQLGQLLGSGTVHAEEFNSVLEGVPTIVQAAARGIKEANGSVAELKQLVISGKVSSKAFFDGFEAGAVSLQAKVATAETTISGGFVRLYNVLTDVAKNFNENAKAADLMSGFLDELGAAARELGNDLSNAAPLLKEFGDYLNAINGWAEGLGKKIGEATGLDQVAPAINNALSNVNTDPAEAKITELQKTVTALQDAIKFNTEMGIDTSTVQGQLDQVLAKIAAIKAGAAVPLPNQSDQSVAAAINGMVPFNPLSPISTPETVKPVSLADYPVTGTKKKGGSHGIKKTADDAFEEDLQSIRDRTAALKEEHDALGLTYEEQQKRKVALDLEQQALKDVREAARKKGDTDWQNIQLSEQQKAAIDKVADAYAKQADELRKAQDMMDLQRDVLKGAFDDLRGALDDGKLDWQDLGNIALNALDKIIDKIENDLIDAILQANSTAGGGGGIFGSLLGVLGLGGGSDPGIISALGLRAAGGPVQAGKPYIVGEKRPELFVPNQSGTILPSVPTVQPGDTTAGGATISPVFAPQISMNGNGDTEAVIAEMRKFLDREFLPRTLKALRQAKTLGMSVS
jgi:tape measure domain-containing protein